MSRSSRLLRAINEVNSNQPKSIEQVFSACYISTEKISDEVINSFKDTVRKNYEGRQYDFLIMEALIKKGQSFKLLESNEEENHLTLQEITGKKRCFVLYLRPENNIWTPFIYEDKMVKRFDVTKKGQKATEIVWVEDKNAPEIIQKYIKENIDKDTGTFKIKTDKGNIENEINELIELTTTEITGKEVVDFEKYWDKKKNESFCEADESGQGNQNTNQSNSEKGNQNSNNQQNDKYNLSGHRPAFVVLIFRLEKKGWTISKAFPKQAALLVTKDRQRQFILVIEGKDENDDPIWEIGSLNSNNNGSDYQIYDKKIKRLVDADDDLKRQHKVMTNIVRNTNFKSDLYKPLGDITKTLSQGIGASLGLALFGPLGAYVGGKAADWVRDKASLAVGGAKQKAGEATGKLVNKTKQGIKNTVRNMSNRLMDKFKKFNNPSLSSSQDYRLRNM